MSKLFFSSMTYKAYIIFHDRVLSHPIYLFFTDFSFISHLWQKSLVYLFLSGKLSLVSEKIYKPSGAFLELCCLLPLLSLLIFPSRFQGVREQILLTCLSLILNIRFPTSKKNCTDNIFFFVIWLFFSSVLFLILKEQAFALISRLLISAAFYYIVVSSVENEFKFKLYKKLILILVVILCIYSLIIQNNIPYNPRITAEKIILTAPLALSVAYSFKPKLRNFFYFISILFCSYLIILQSDYPAAKLGFCISIIVFIGLLNIKYLFLLIILLPAIIVPPILQLIDVFSLFTQKTDFFSGLIFTAANFWINGLNIASEPFLNLYRSATLSPQYGIYFDPYIKAIISLGFAILFITLWYNLKLIRSAIVNIFTAPQKYKPVFSAGISSLIGISLYGILGLFSLSLQSLLCYCIVLGTLSVQTRIKESKNP